MAPERSIFESLLRKWGKEVSQVGIKWAGGQVREGSMAQPPAWGSGKEYLCFLWHRMVGMPAALSPSDSWSQLCSSKEARDRINQLCGSLAQHRGGDPMGRGWQPASIFPASLTVWPRSRHWTAVDLRVSPFWENRVHNTCPIRRRNEVMFMQHCELAGDNACILLNSNNNNHYCKSYQ